MDSLNISGFIRRLDQARVEALSTKYNLERVVEFVKTQDDFESLYRLPITTDDGPLALSCQLRCLANDKACSEEEQHYVFYRKPCFQQCCKGPKNVLWKYTHLCEKGLHIALEGHNKGLWVFRDNFLVEELSDDIEI